jgi:urea transport system permease protein
MIASVHPVTVLRQHQRLAGWTILWLIPWVLSPLHLDLFREFLLFSIFAVSLSLLWGQTGLLSFGHAAFFGLGGYAYAILTTRASFTGAPYLGLLLALLVPALVAGILGYFLFYGGVRGPYFAIVTMAVAIIFEQIAINWVSLTNGQNGIFGIPSLTVGTPGVWEYPIQGGVSQAYLALSAFTVLYLLVKRIVCSNFGLILRTIRDNERRAEFLGFDTALYCVIVFTLAAAVAGLAGALYAATATFVSPSLLGMLFSTQVLIWVAVGGRVTLAGAIIGTFLVKTLEFYISSWQPEIWPIILGILFLAVVSLFPDGLAPHLPTWWDLARARLWRPPELQYGAEQQTIMEAEGSPDQEQGGTYDGEAASPPRGPASAKAVRRRDRDR